MATELSNELDFEIKVKKPKSYILTDPKAIFRIQMAKTRRKVQEMTLNITTEKANESDMYLLNGQSAVNRFFETITIQKKNSD